VDRDQALCPWDGARDGQLLRLLGGCLRWTAHAPRRRDPLGHRRQVGRLRLANEKQKPQGVKYTQSMWWRSAGTPAADACLKEWSG
jgi:hypothetical protein